MDYRQKFAVEPGTKVRLSKIDASYTGKHETHEKALPEIQVYVERMDKLQYLLTRTPTNLFSWSRRSWMPPERTALFATCSAA